MQILITESVHQKLRLGNVCRKSWNDGPGSLILQKLKYEYLNMLLKTMKYKNLQTWKNKEIGLKKENNSFSLNNQLSYAFFKRAVYFFKHKKYFDCLETLDLAIKYNQFEAQFFSFKAFVFGIFLKDFKIALREVNEALKLNPQSESANFLKEHLIKLQSKKEIYNFYI